MTYSVSLRALEPEDLELVHQIENDPALWQWSASNVPLSRYTVRQYLAQQHADLYLDGQLRLVITADCRPVGIADLTDFSPRHLRAEVGIVVLPEFHRRGIARAALRQLRDYAATQFRLRSLYAYVAQDNQPAQALFRALGYTVAAQLPRWIEGRSTATLFQLML